MENIIKKGVEPVKPLVFESKIVGITVENLFSLISHHQIYHEMIQGLFENSQLLDLMGIKLVDGSLISKNAELGKDLIVEQGSIILGKTKILKGRIEKGSVIISSVVKDIEAGKDSMMVWLEQVNDKKVIAKQNELVADAIILDDQIIKKVRINIDEKKKGKSFWNLKLWQEVNVVEYDESKRYSLAELFKFADFGISDLRNLSANPMDRYYFHLGGSYREFKQSLLDQPIEELFKHIEISKRLTKEPIIRPSNARWRGIRWEKLAYNSTKIRVNGMTYFIYRTAGEDHIFRLGFAWSKDGIHIDGRLSWPILWLDQDEIHPNAASRPRERGGIEDPHLTLLKDEGRIVLLYTIAFATKEQICQQSCASMAVEDFVAIPELSELEIKQKWKKHGLISDWEERNSILFPEKVNNKYAMIRRPIKGGTVDLEEYKRQKRDIGISFSDVLEGRWPEEMDLIIKNREGMWDADRVGPSALLKTNKGWLFFYHGVGKLRGRKSYMTGWALLDINNPRKVLARSDEPILIPEEDHELYGWAPNVAIGYGATIKGKDSDQIVEDDDEILISYGGGDRVVSLLSIKFSDIIKML